MAYIKDSFVERIKEEANILDVIGTYSDLKKKGKNYFCLSPFTEEKTASCAVDEVNQRFKDFSSGKSGDVIAFLMEKETLTYPQAIEWLAEKYGYTVEYEDEEWAKEKEDRLAKKESLRPLLKAALQRYRDAFKALPDDHKAKIEIYKNRQYSDEIVLDWQIGFAPGGKLLFEELAKIDRLDDGREAFLIGDEYDKFWNRVIYPIHDENGLLIGLAGRDITGDKKAAKWINPSTNTLYNKDKTWFAMHRAKEMIRKSAEAWIVEGYNDVIAWHTHGLTNTIAPCGTAITERQIKILRRYCQRVILCMDGDIAGIKSMLTYIPQFIANGFQVDVAILEDTDPDEFVRKNADKLNDRSADRSLDKLIDRKNGFSFLLDHYLEGSEINKAKGTQELIKIVATVDDVAMQEIYLGWIGKESNITRAKIDKWFKAEMDKTIEKNSMVKLYELPREVKVPLSEIQETIDKYGLFMAHDQIWMMTGKEKPFKFISCSNFTIEIIQHMQDDKFPMKLVRIRNTRGEERIFDVPSEQLNTPMAFDNAMTNHGNFLWIGGRNEFQRLRSYLFDRMGVGSKIEVLGWQPEKFWVWNNGITIPGKGTSDIDENGIFRNGKTSYYIPSANRIYESNSFKFTPQKKVVLKNSDVSFMAYAEKMMQVHREHAMTGLLFTVASCFLDIIEDKLGNFPLLFLYGPASTGKDQLIDCCQSFYGDPQSPIHIGNKVSTAKAQVRKFAQFRNMIVHLSEYRPGDQMLDELLKGLWDRRGYERGTIDSAYGTETVPIHSSVIFTGNHYPDDDALITRFICEEMTKTDFSLVEKKQYQELKDMNRKGISKFTAEMIDYRAAWEEKFKERFRKIEREMKESLGLTTAHDRMISNIAILATAMKLMDEVLVFPFSLAQFIAHSKSMMEKQVRKLNTASVQMKWWDCFVGAIRTRTDSLVHGREFEVKDNQLYFNFTHCFNRVMMQWWNQYHEQTPSKSKISDVLKKDSTFVEEKNSHRMEQRKSSVWVIDLKLLPAADDLQEAVQWQIKEKRDMPAEEPNPYAPKSDGQDRLPF